jgi:hypothetical protein
VVARLSPKDNLHVPSLCDSEPSPSNEGGRRTLGPGPARTASATVTVASGPGPAAAAAGGGADAAGVPAVTVGTASSLPVALEAALRLGAGGRTRRPGKHG